MKKVTTKTDSRCPDSEAEDRASRACAVVAQLERVDVPLKVRDEKEFEILTPKEEAQKIEDIIKKYSEKGCLTEKWDILIDVINSSLHAEAKVILAKRYGETNSGALIAAIEDSEEDPDVYTGPENMSRSEVIDGIRRLAQQQDDADDASERGAMLELD